MSAATLARRAWRTLEPYHGFVYFSPVAAASYERLGLPPTSGYFASRAAAMGAVPAEVVIATFFNFAPRMVHSAIPSAWEVATPAAVAEARLGAVDEHLRALLGDDVVASDAMREAAELASVAARACEPAGRPLFAGHASLAWPDEPHLVLWHAVTLLREHRGDGHVAALVVEGLDGCEALHTHGTAGHNAIPLDLLQHTRGWTDDEWADARARLVARALLDDDGFTDRGAAMRARIEERTDDLAAGPWSALGEERTERLRTLVRPFSRAIVASGVFGLAG